MRLNYKIVDDGHIIYMMLIHGIHILELWFETIFFMLQNPLFLFIILTKLVFWQNTVSLLR